MIQLAQRRVRPEGFRLRKVEEDDYVDGLHRQASGRERTWLWPAIGRWIWLPVLLLAFLQAGPLLRWWDATAAVLDAGVLSLLVLALLVVLAARWMASHGVYKPMVERLNELEPWQQVLVYGCLHLSYFCAVVAVMIALV